MDKRTEKQILTVAKSIWFEYFRKEPEIEFAVIQKSKSFVQKDCLKFGNYFIYRPRNRKNLVIDVIDRTYRFDKYEPPEYSFKKVGSAKNWFGALSKTINFILKKENNHAETVCKT